MRKFRGIRVDSEFAYSIPNFAAPSVVFPEGLKAVADRMFRSCEGAHTVVLPRSLISIGAAAFSGMRYSGGITEICVYRDSPAHKLLKGKNLKLRVIDDISEVRSQYAIAVDEQTEMLAALSGISENQTSALPIIMAIKSALPGDAVLLDLSDAPAIFKLKSPIESRLYERDITPEFLRTVLSARNKLFPDSPSILAAPDAVLSMCAWRQYKKITYLGFVYCFYEGEPKYATSDSIGSIAIITRNEYVIYAGQYLTRAGGLWRVIGNLWAVIDESYIGLLKITMSQWDIPHIHVKDDKIPPETDSVAVFSLLDSAPIIKEADGLSSGRQSEHIVYRYDILNNRVLCFVNIIGATEPTLSDIMSTEKFISEHSNSFELIEKTLAALPGIIENFEPPYASACAEAELAIKLKLNDKNAQLSAFAEWLRQCPFAKRVKLDPKKITSFVCRTYPDGVELRYALVKFKKVTRYYTEIINNDNYECFSLFVNPLKLFNSLMDLTAGAQYDCLAEYIDKSDICPITDTMSKAGFFGIHLLSGKYVYAIVTNGYAFSACAFDNFSDILKFCEMSGTEFGAVPPVLMDEMLTRGNISVYIKGVRRVAQTLLKYRELKGKEDVSANKLFDSRLMLLARK